VVDLLIQVLLGGHEIRVEVFKIAYPEWYADSLS